MSQPPLIAHLIYALDFGGLETLLVDCINHMPPEKYRHAVICVTRYTDFAGKIARPGVELHALDKPPGPGLATHRDVWRLMRRLRPDIVHTYNLPAVEYALAAALAGVPVRIHAEHGRDAGDPHGRNYKHNLLRRLLTPLIDCYVPVSHELKAWLRETIHVPEHKNRLINNGVDTDRFRPQSPPHSDPHWPEGSIVIGSVGRIQDVKNHAGLVDAFALLRESLPELRDRLRLSIIGDGPLLPTLRDKVSALGLDDAVWLPGARHDIPDLMNGFSVFALSSLAEGTPVTLLEAMSAALPVVATRVGGIPEVVLDDRTGALVAAGDPVALAQALAQYCRSPQLRKKHGHAGRERAIERYGTLAMVDAYTRLYDELRASKLGLADNS